MVNEATKTIAYVYKWVHTPSLKWYIGSRTAKGCHPEDGYICSSKIVKPLIKANPQEWVRTIVETGSPKYMRELEGEILTLFDAKNDPRSFNMQNGDGKFTTAGMVRSEDEKARISASMKGVPKPPRSAEHCAKMSAAKKGKTHKPHSLEARIKMSEAKKGVPKSAEHRAKISAAQIKTIIATNLTTGETFEIRGGKEMVALGFNQGCVSKCARGVSKSHKGHTFKFKSISQDVEVLNHE